MTDNEFAINPESLNTRTRRNNRRPLPPGQTRHLYDAEEDRDSGLYDDDDEPRYETDEAPYDDDAETSMPRNKPSKKSKKGTRTSRQARRNAPSDDEGEETPAVVNFLMDRRVAIWLGLVSILVGCAVFILLLGYIRTGSLDQALILNLSPEEIAESGLKVKGGIGPFGAWLGHILFAESFGIGAFIIAAYFAILGWKLLMGRKFGFWGLTFRCALLAVTVSIVVGLLTYTLGSETFWGGVHGHYVNKWLLDMTGVPGTLFVSILLIGTVIVVYINEIRLFYKRWRERMQNQRNERLARQEHERNLRNASKAGAVDSPEVSEGKEAALSHGHEQSLTAKTDASEGRGKTDIGFVIDTPAPQSAPHNETSGEATRKDSAAKAETEGEAASEPGFVIDVPVADVGRTTGSVAERLVAEQGEIDPRAELSRYKFPTLDMLENLPITTNVDAEEQQMNKDRIIKTLGNYNITVSSIKATVGPTVTLFEIVPDDGIRIAQIKRLEDDIALSLAAKGIRIIAPMPGKGTVGIEVPNKERQVVSMRAILSSNKFRDSKANLPVALGATISNEVFVSDLAAMPHALVAGATGQGKSVGLNVLIASLLFRKHPTELKFVLIDPKMVEFSVYERLRGHYLASLPGEEEAIVTDSSKVLNVLNSLCAEMDMRYALLKKACVNKIEDYNKKYCQRRLSADQGHKFLPYIVVIIDEFADLIMTGGREIELPVMRITQKARAVGIHMIIATQRPSTNVLTGLIKANCPSRIAFRVLQNVDSRTILDRPGAEQLIGKGDMLYSQGGDLERMQCAFISSDEILGICDYIDEQPGFEQPYILPEPSATQPGVSGGGLPGGGLDRDPLFDEAARFIILSSTASTSSLQRRFEIGYNRAGKIMDQMEAAGIVGPASGSKPRSVLVDSSTLENILANR